MTNQELLERYVHSTWLPADIAAEIRSNLESQIEDQAAQLGRELSLEEVSAILKRHGHPAAVAYRYRTDEGHGLICPALFPLYRFTLRAILALMVVIKVVKGAFTFSGQPEPGLFVLQFVLDLLLSGFFIFGGVTLIFALWERAERKFRLSERWKPESLPPIPTPGRPPQHRPYPYAMAIDAAAALVFLTLLLYTPWLSWVWGARGMFSPSETLYAMRLPILALAACWTAISWFAHSHFVSAHWRRNAYSALIAAGLVLAIYLLRSGDLLVPGPEWTSGQAKSLATLNRMAAGTLVLACVVAGLVCLQEVRRLIRPATGGGTVSC